MTTLETIVINGDLISQSWLETGTSVEFLSEEDLEVRPGLDSTNSVLEQTVNVTMPTGTAKGPTVRGVDGNGPAEGANAFFAGSRARFGLQIDGRPANYNEIVYGNSHLWDVERVELLRGPQSTLTGRNAIAGTMSIRTNDPTFDYSAAIETSAGNFNSHRLSGMVNVPIIDGILATRFAADWQGSQSAVNYTAFEGVEKPGEIEDLMLRGKMLLLPDIALGSSLVLTAAHTSHRAPQSEIIKRPFSQNLAATANQPVHQPSSTSLSGEFEVDLSDFWSLEADGSVTRVNFKRWSTSSPARIEATEFGIDPRVRYRGANGLEALFGAHAFITRQDEYIEIIEDLNFDDKTDTYAVYGEVIVPAAETVKVKLAARYEHERHRRSGGDADGSLADIDFNRTFEAFLPKIDVNWQPRETQSYGFLVSKGYNAGGGGITFAAPVVHYQFDSETVWNYELYGRQEFLDNRLQLTQNVFFAHYTDMQIPFDLTPQNATDESFVVRNAKSVITYGAEFGAAFDVTDEVSLFGNVGLLQTDIREFPGSGVEGNQLLTAPNVTASAGINWAHNGFSAGLSARYSDGYFTSINNRPRGKTDPYVVADAKVGYEFKNFRVFGEVNNIFDNDSPIAYYAKADPASDNAVLLQPRTFRLGLSAKF